MKLWWTILDENLVERSQQDPNPWKLCAGDGSPLDDQQKEEQKQHKPNRNEVDAATVDLFMFFFFFGKTDTHPWFLGGTVDQS